MWAQASRSHDMNGKTALITGVLGQDGSYLSELLATEGYNVYGVAKKDLSANSVKIFKHLKGKGCYPEILDCDLHSYNDVVNIIRKITPDEIYHLATTHYPSQAPGAKDDLDRKLFTDNVSSTLNILTAMSEAAPQSRCVLAGSCLMFDASDESPQHEHTSFRSGSIYGLAKITEFNIGRFFRDKGMHVSMAFLYNHESPRRAASFVTQKIVKSMVLVKQGKLRDFELGNLDTIRDWGYAKDYVRGLSLMARQQSPGDYILATGKGHTVKDFIIQVAKALEITDWESHVKLNPDIINRDFTAKLIGVPSLAERVLTWRRSVDFEALVGLMVQSELEGEMD